MSKGRGKRKKGWKTGRLHWPGSHHDGHDHADMAERLTPLEETGEFKQSLQDDGGPDAVKDTIRIDNKAIPMPEHLVEEEREGASIFHLEPVVFFIIVAMLAFMAFVAWQITLMPAKQ